MSDLDLADLEREVAQHHTLLAELDTRLHDTMRHVAGIEAVVADLEVHAKMLTARFDQRFGNVRPTCHRCGRVLNADGGCQFGCSK